MAFMESVAADPRRVLERVDSARGLVIVRWLDCETENPIKILRHACGESIAPALEELLTGMREAIELAKDQPDDDPWVRCKGGAQPECVVPADGECLPNYTLVFAAERSDAPLVAVLERNDWQFPPESSAEVDGRVRELHGTERQRVFAALRLRRSTRTGQTASIRPAAPWPPPTHIVMMP